MNIQAVLFDKDGTLVDFHATYDAATARVLKQICSGDHAQMRDAADVLGFDWETESIQDNSIIVAGSGFDITQTLAPVLGVDDVEEYSKFLDRLYGEICVDTVRWIPGIPEALNILHGAGYSLGIATNDSENNARSQLSTLKSGHLFSQILGADSGYGGKPGPGMINAFANRIAADCSTIMMVGDSTHDLQAGKAAGSLTCGVLTGPASREELLPEADHVINSVVDLPALLDELV